MPSSEDDEDDGYICVYNHLLCAGPLRRGECAPRRNTPDDRLQAEKKIDFSNPSNVAFEFFSREKKAQSARRVRESERERGKNEGSRDTSVARHTVSMFREILLPSAACSWEKKPSAAKKRAVSRLCDRFSAVTWTTDGLYWLRAERRRRSSTRHTSANVVSILYQARHTCAREAAKRADFVLDFASTNVGSSCVEND